MTRISLPLVAEPLRVRTRTRPQTGRRGATIFSRESDSATNLADLSPILTRIVRPKPCPVTMHTRPTRIRDGRTESILGAAPVSCRTVAACRTAGALGEAGGVAVVVVVGVVVGVATEASGAVVRAVGAGGAVAGGGTDTVVVGAELVVVALVVVGVVGGTETVNEAAVVVAPATVVTVNGADDAWAGTTAVTASSPATVKRVGVAPNVTEVVQASPEPEIVTIVPG